MIRRRVDGRFRSSPVRPIFGGLLVVGAISVALVAIPAPSRAGGSRTPEASDEGIATRGEESQTEEEEGQAQDREDAGEPVESAESAGSAFDVYRSRVPPAAAGDVETIDAIVSAVYESISGPSDEPREWERFRSLFIPGARLIPTGPGPDGEGEVRIAVWSVDDYIEQADPFFQEMGFYEKELARRTERYGNLAHVFSTYESRLNPESPEPFQRGVNSFQLVHDGERWWIVTIFWRGESDDAPLPQRYLTTPRTGGDEEGGAR